MWFKALEYSANHNKTLEEAITAIQEPGTVYTENTNNRFNTVNPYNYMPYSNLMGLVNEYGENNFIEAVRIAEAKRKLNLAYIEGILKNEK